MSEAVKYTFSESFEPATENDPQGKAAAQEAEQIAMLRKEAYDHGYKDGQDEAINTMESQSIKVLDTISHALTALNEDRSAYKADLAIEATQLAHSVATAIAHNLMERYPMEELEALIKECLNLSIGEPRLVIRLHKDEINMVQDKMDQLSQQAAYPGEVILIEGDNLAKGDCLVEWPDGGMERKVAGINDEIQSLLQRHLKALENSKSNPDMHPKGEDHHV